MFITVAIDFLVQPKGQLKTKFDYFNCNTCRRVEGVRMKVQITVQVEDQAGGVPCWSSRDIRTQWLEWDEDFVICYRRR